MAFSCDQRWLVISSADEHAAAQVWDLQEMRQELSSRGLDLPADLLRITPVSPALTGEIEIQVDATGIPLARTADH